jgi:hypothetical protein
MAHAAWSSRKSFRLNLLFRPLPESNGRSSSFRIRFNLPLRSGTSARDSTSRDDSELASWQLEYFDFEGSGQEWMGPLDTPTEAGPTAACVQKSLPNPCAEKCELTEVTFAFQISLRVSW